MSQSLILALDTATQACTVALGEGDEPRSLVFDTQASGNKHSESILEMIKVLLEKTNKTRKDITHIAFAQGPGAFTGLRVACGVAQGLAWGLNIPVVALNNLEVIAYGMLRREAFKVGTRIAIANDARMKEIYTALFEVTEEGLKCLGETTLEKPETLLAILKKENVSIVAGSALKEYEALIGQDTSIAFYPEAQLEAQDLMALAREKIKRNELIQAHEAEPLYVRNRVALTIEQRQRGERL